MNKLIAAVGIVVAAGCADTTAVGVFDRQHTIDVPGNVVGTPGCASIDLVSCFAILDHQIKLLYEQASWAARLGEADYQAISTSNKDLVRIFQGDTTSVSDALHALDRFISAMERARSRGELSSCWGDHLIGFGSWVRAKVAAGDVQVTDAPLQGCRVSAVAGVTVVGSTAQGVVLTIDDPWHYTGDPYGVYATRTYFVVQGPHGAINTTPILQDGPATVVISDPQTNAVGSYAYSVTQCSDRGFCSVPFSFDVEVVEGSGAVCVHDNRDKPRGTPALPTCGQLTTK
jgi:hypothetical protein